MDFLLLLPFTLVALWITRARQQQRRIAILARYLRTNPRTLERSIAAVGRLSKSSFGNHAEFGLIVSDRYQGQGLGRQILTRLIEIGRAENIDSISGLILPENTNMLNIVRQMGFHLEQREDKVFEASLKL